MTYDTVEDFLKEVDKSTSFQQFRSKKDQRVLATVVKVHESNNDNTEEQTSWQLTLNRDGKGVLNELILKRMS